MPKRKINPIYIKFISFLKRNDIYNLFRAERKKVILRQGSDNISSASIGITMQNVFDNDSNWMWGTCQGKYYQFAISHLLSWCQTKQGYDFWYDMHRKWVKESSNF